MTMPSWYDVMGLDERSKETCKGIEASAEKIRSILRDEHELSGLPYSRMVLAGFSQGGALSLFAGMQLEQALAGVLVLSGYLPCANKIRITEGLQDTPILHLHGEADPIVPYKELAESQRVAMDCGARRYSVKSYPDLAHSISPEVVNDMIEFLCRVLPPDNEVNVMDQPGNILGI